MEKDKYEQMKNRITFLAKASVETKDDDNSFTKKGRGVIDLKFSYDDEVLGFITVKSDRYT